MSTRQVKTRYIASIRDCVGKNLRVSQYLLKVDVKTIGEAIAALSGSVEHRGNKKTGGYYVSG